MLDDAIRQHLELKRRAGAPDDEVTRLESEAFGPVRREEPAPAAAEPEPVAAAEPAAAPPPPPPAPAAEETPPAPPARVEEDWLEDDEPEVPAAQHTAEFTAREQEDAGAPPASDYVAPDEEGDDLLEETPDFLQETPEHDRLWFEQKPPKDFDV